MLRHGGTDMTPTRALWRCLCQAVLCRLGASSKKCLSRSELFGPVKPWRAAVRIEALPGALNTAPLLQGFKQRLRGELKGEAPS
jgi:hypothetical protein